MTSPAPFAASIHVRWPDTDQNGHMRTVAYLEVAEDVRMQYFAQQGLTMDTFLAQRVGPVVFTDHIAYRAEMRLLERATVRLELAGLSPDGARVGMRNTIVREDGRTAATIDSQIGWLDLDARRLRVPPEEVRACLELLARTGDFVDLAPLARRESAA